MSRATELQQNQGVFSTNGLEPHIIEDDVATGDVLVEITTTLSPRGQDYVETGSEYTRPQIIDTMVFKAFSNVFQRDSNGNGGGDRSQQSLSTYNREGEYSNPALNENYAEHHKNAVVAIERKTRTMTDEELSYLSMILPDLAASLVQKNDLVDQIYKPDFANIINIAVDWFAHPDKMGDTHFRIGFGGAESVNSRAPAYIVPAMETLESVRCVYANYTNWALNRELCATGKNAKGINRWISERLYEEYAILFGNGATQEEIENELISPTKFTPEHIQSLMEDACEEFTGFGPDYESISQKYHVPAEMPKVVVFNASNAAIEIDGMDRERVMATRERTQRLLRDHVSEYYPESLDNLVFQNDLPWEEQDVDTRLHVRYTYDLVTSFNSTVEEAREKLAQFGAHHKSDTAMEIPTYKGIRHSDLYGALHPLFFADQLNRPVLEQMPSTQVMDPMDPPRNLIFHQGPPELVFGQFRKIYADYANLSEYIGWLEQRKKMSEIGSVSQVSERIIDRAQSIFEAAQKAFELAQNKQPEKKKKPPTMRNALGTSLTQICGDNRSLKDELLAFMRNEQYKDHPDQIEAWQTFISQLDASRLDTHIPEESPEELERAIARVREHQNAMNTLHNALFTLGKKDKDEKEERQALIIIDQHGHHLYPRQGGKLEETTTIGKVPTYYIHGGDAEVYPNYVEPSFDRYTEDIDGKENRHNRIKETTDFVKKRHLESFPKTHLEVTQAVRDMEEKADKVRKLGVGEVTVNQFRKQELWRIGESIPGEDRSWILKQSQNQVRRERAAEAVVFEDSLKEETAGQFRTLYEDVDTREVAGGNTDELTEFVMSELTRIRRILTEAQYGEAEVTDDMRFMISHLMLIAARQAQTEITSETASIVDTARAVAKDYATMTKKGRQQKARQQEKTRQEEVRAQQMELHRRERAERISAHIPVGYL